MLRRLLDAYRRETPSEQYVDHATPDVLADVLHRTPQQLVRDSLDAAYPRS